MLADRALDLGLDLNVWPWVWLSMAVIFALIELTVLGGSFVLLPFAVSAFVASILGFYDVAIEIQWAVFVFGGGVLFFFLYRWARTFMANNTKPLGVGADRLVGMTAIVTSPIVVDDTDRRGRISVEGEVWGAISDADFVIPQGARVRITAMLGTRAVVEPIPPGVQPTSEEQP
jgi:membrane protein implicated in regulation of membrane protease activity